MTSLESGYMQAESLVHGFKLRGMGPAPAFDGGTDIFGGDMGMDFFGVAIAMPLLMGNLADPGWDPSYNRPSPQAGSPGSQAQAKPERPAECRALAREIGDRKNRIRRMQHRREALKSALEKLQKGQKTADGTWKWEADLKDYVEESQTAQTNAIINSLGLLDGAGGPIDEAIKRWRAGIEKGNQWFNAGGVGARLQATRAALDGPGMPLGNPSLATLKKQYDLWIRATGEEGGIERCFRGLSGTVDDLQKVALGTESVKIPLERHNILLVTKTLEDSMVDLVKGESQASASLGVSAEDWIDRGKGQVRDFLVQGGLKSYSRIIGLADFYVKYGLESMRFYVSFKGVHDILGYIDDVNRLSDNLGSQIVDITDHVKSLSGELGDLSRSYALGSSDACKNALHGLDQKEMYEAYLAGEWFSQQTGVRAPGYSLEYEGRRGGPPL